MIPMMPFPRMSDISIRRALILVGIIIVTAVTFAIAWNDLNYSFFLGLLFDDAQEFARTGVISSDFMPIGYSGFLGVCLKAVGLGGVPACQALVYAGVLSALLLFLLLRGVRGTLLIIGTVAVALHPVLVLNIWRIHDGNLTVLFFLGFLVAGIFFLRQRTVLSIIVLGALFGLLFSVRQNTLPLLLIVPLLFLNDRPLRVANFFRRTFIFMVSAVIFIVAVNILFKGMPFFFGRQGPYNLFSGTNEYASKYLLLEYSGENSLKDALPARGFAVPSLEDRLQFPPERYTQLSIEYITSHPLGYAKLTALKVITLLRPGYHVVEGFSWISSDGIKRLAKIVLAVPIWIWLFFVFRTRKSFFETGNLFIVLAIIVYALPFLAANADPRYRFPLDIIFIADSFCRAGILPVPQRFKKRADRVTL